MDNPVPRQFLSALYPVAGLLIIAPIVELVASTWPIRPFETGWRFGSIGIGFGTAVIQIAGLAMAMAIAALLGHRAVLRSLASLAIVAAFLVLASMTRFLLDFADVRSVIPIAERNSIDAATLRALLFASLSVPVLVVLGGRGWVASRRPDPRRVVAVDDHIIPLRRHRPGG